MNARRMIELRSVTKVYGEGAARVHALAGIDLSIGAGEYVSVMGAAARGAVPFSAG
jgi:putative ABC transport system ATP-binding protein